MTETLLDQAHSAMESAPNDDAARLRFFERLAESELFLLLAKDADGENVEPEMFETEAGTFVLVFDREERLAKFVGKIAPYAAMSGRVITDMLNGQNIGLGVNLSVAPSETLLPAEAVTWLCETLSNAPDEVEETPEIISPPAGLPETLITALDSKLATAEGMAKFAYLAGVEYSGGRKSHILAFIDPLPGADTALARAMGEALTFSGVEAGVLDVAFFAASDPICALLAKNGLRFDLPVAQIADGPAAPGMDPNKPPILR